MDTLKLRRLLTTNYDFELECGLERLGFEQGRLAPNPEGEPNPSDHDAALTAERHSGDRARSLVLKKDTAAELAGFAVEASGYRYEIFHLHGRALSDESEELVITERDYQKTYLRDTPEANIMNEALSATMAGNPIVFIGLGMSEADILRPLRRFVSASTKPVNRAIVAIMPAEQSKSARARAALQLYLRYGVHTIFYGWERDNEANAMRPKRDEQTRGKSAPWNDPKNNDVAHEPRLYRSIRRIRALRSLLGEGRKAGEPIPKSFLRWKTRETNWREHLLDEVAWSEFALPNETICVLPLARKVLSLIMQDDAFWPSDADRGKRISAHNAVYEVLGAIDSSVRTRALCHKLNKVERDWWRWWQEWRELPVARKYAHEVKQSSFISGRRPRSEWGQRLKLDKALALAFNDKSGVLRSIRYETMTPRDLEFPSRKPAAALTKEIANKIFEVVDDSADRVKREKARSEFVSPSENSLETRPHGTKIYVVHGREGSGRGAFVAELSHLIGRPEVGDKNERRHAWALFTNARFSTEYSSVIDGTIEFFNLLLKGDAERAALWKRPDAQHHRDIKILSALNDIYGANSKVPEEFRTRRGLLVFGGFELLFRGIDGGPKNSEIVEVIAKVLNVANHSAAGTPSYPLDIVLVCNTDKLESMFFRTKGDLEKFKQNPEAELECSLAIGPTKNTVDNAKPEEVRINAHFIDLEKIGIAHALACSVSSGAINEKAAVQLNWLDNEIKDALYGKQVFDIMREYIDAPENKPVFPDKSLWSQSARRDSGDLREALTGPFQLTIFAKCALEVYEAAIADGEDKAKEAVEQFIHDVGSAMARTERSRWRDQVLEGVQRQYRKTHQKTSTKPAPELCDLILKHLSIMSAPVEVSVLCRCPEIEKWVEDHYRVKNKKQDDEFRAVRIRSEVVLALQALERRRLCFRVATRIEPSNAGAEQREANVEAGELLSKDVPLKREAWGSATRFVVHKSLQSHYFRQIGSPHLEFGDSRLFTVSMYASQHPDLPAPTWEAYNFMIALLRKLIGYPSKSPKRPAQEYRTESERRDDVFALRAGLSLVRSAFSLAVVSRFAEFNAPPNSRKTSFGYMEEFRLLLRWMIYRAGILGIECTDEIINEMAKKSKCRPDSLRDMSTWKKEHIQYTEERYPERVNAFYQDEITWLYNECGLVSLSQGSLNDAAALFDAASRSNGSLVKGMNIGPNGLRIRLNAAIARLERGNLESANREFEKLQRDAKREPAVWAIARGYEGLVAHLKGRNKQAKPHYQQAIGMLRKLRGEARAISIFSRHLGDFLRASDPAASRQYHHAALAEAEIARQHDMVQHAHVSIILAEIDNAKGDDFDARKLLNRLNDVIAYADRMELHTLKVDALNMRAKIIERQGETRAAGEAAIAGLTIANINGMRLRTAAALSSLGRIVAGRPGYQQQARRILRSARMMAEEAGYQHVQEDADKALIGLGDGT